MKVCKIRKIAIILATVLICENVCTSVFAEAFGNEYILEEDNCITDDTYNDVEDETDNDTDEFELDEDEFYFSEDNDDIINDFEEDRSEEFDENEEESEFQDDADGFIGIGNAGGEEGSEILLNETMEASASTTENPAAVLREGLKARKSTITILCKTAIRSNLSREIWNEAMAFSGDPQEGDYLTWNYAGWSASYRSLAGTVRITYKVNYYTTIEQENELTAKVNEVLSSLNLQEKSYVEGLKAIYDYICLNVSYDDESEEDDDLQYTAYAAMMNGKAVCQGYAALFYRMAVQAGYHVRVIGGYSNAGEHAWNLIGVNGEYYYVDATRDASNAKRGRPYKFFLIGSNTSDYVRDDEFLTEEFVNRYPMAVDDYHEFDKKGVPATLTENGYYQNKCIICGKMEEATEIFRPAQYVMDETECVFDGKLHPAKLQIFDTEGNKIPTSEYSIRYYNMNGVSFGVPYGAMKYRVQITFSGNYSGVHNEYYEIKKAPQNLKAFDLKLVYGVDDNFVPKYTTDSGLPVRLGNTGNGVFATDGKKIFLNTVGNAYMEVIAPGNENYRTEKVRVKISVIPEGTKMVSVTAKKAKTAALTWKSVKNVRGYEIQYSTKSNFKSSKSIKITNDKTTSKVLTGLNAGKYYVRIRTFQYNSGAAYYSAWSHAMTVKVAAK